VNKLYNTSLIRGQRRLLTAKLSVMPVSDAFDLTGWWLCWIAASIT